MVNVQLLLYFPVNSMYTVSWLMNLQNLVAPNG